MSYTQCCVPGCETSSKLHRFPGNNSQTFKIWAGSIGRDLSSLNKKYIYKNLRVCHSHFEERFHYGNKLTRNAVPTLNIPGKADPKSNYNVNVQESVKKVQKYGIFYTKTKSVEKQKEIDKLLSDVRKDQISSDNTLDKVTNILGPDCEYYKVDINSDDLVNVVIDGRKKATEDLDTVPEQPPNLLLSTEEEQTQEVLDQPALSQISKYKTNFAVSSEQGKLKSQISVNQLIKTMKKKNLTIAKYYDSKRKHDQELHNLRKKKMQLELFEKGSKI